MVSQDTSAYGVDVKYRTGFWNGQPVKTRMFELCEKLGQLADRFGAWVRLHYVYPYPHVDEVLPLMATGRVLPYLDVPFQHSHPDVLKRMKRPASGEKNLERLARWRELCPELVVRSTFIAGFPGETEAEFEHLLALRATRPASTVPAALPIRRSRARRPTSCPARCRRRVREERRARFMAVAERVSAARLQRRVGATMQVLIDSAPSLGPQGRRRAQLCRCARDRRHGAPAAAGEGEQDLEGRRVHARAKVVADRRPRPGRAGHLTGHATWVSKSASSTRLIHHPYQPPAASPRRSRAGGQGLDGLLPERRGAARAHLDGPQRGYTYGLHGTPTTFTLEERIATLEGGTPRVLVPSGLAAITLVDMALLKPAATRCCCPTTPTARARPSRATSSPRWGIAHRDLRPAGSGLAGGSHHASHEAGLARSARAR